MNLQNDSFTGTALACQCVSGRTVTVTAAEPVDFDQPDCLMAGFGLFVGALAIFLGQPICQALGLPAWATMILQVLVYFPAVAPNLADLV